ncbi:UNKNOWN [Stylonychia lemnae]|uniref:Acyl-coenzyme A oxidase n=1 Tax=Stylonychia lemnae TaxID=5949 RepID=A0A078ALI2_STYLE|nr:UNKNOWN [Stylonychia lemnae]|eukprot:CDW83079.1 UNKNOWN [Stylonychia lemnae]
MEQTKIVMDQLKAFDPEISKGLQQLFFNDKQEKVQKWQKLFEDPVFYPKYDIPLDAQRQLAYDRLKKVSEAKLFSIFDFNNDPKNLLTAHEMLGYTDGSLATKFTVQFNLFGGTLMATSTDRHMPFMKKVDDLTNMGCFCFSELGYGNNAPKMETTAHYDDKTKTFTIHSPTTLSQKYWITNGACHANQAIVFAQTIVKGKNEGVNPFIVRVRDDNMKPCAGVTIEDMGFKMGLNGIDNAKLKFNQVKIPRENMLNKINDVTEAGDFVSPIPKVTQRFFKVADRLLSGRLCIAAMCLSTCKMCLCVAVKYSQQRLGVGLSGESDTPIMAYQLQQNALMPLIARTAVLNFGYNDAKDLFANPTGREFEQIKTFCVVKTMVGWHLQNAATVCRERCGGGGFTAHAQLHQGIAGAHSGMTAEGDNRVLMQKVVKDILADLQQKRHRLPAMTKCPRKGIPSQDFITDLETLTNLIYYREHAEIKNMTDILKKKIMEEGKKFFDVWMYEVSDEIQNLATAFGERIFLEGALNRLNAAKSDKLKEVLFKTIRLHCLHQLKENLGWYLMNGVINAKAAKYVDADYQQAVKALVPHINDIIEAYDYPRIAAMNAPIARDYVKFNEQPDSENVNAAGGLFDFKKGPKL